MHQASPIQSLSFFEPAERPPLSGACEWPAGHARDGLDASRVSPDRAGWVVDNSSPLSRIRRPRSANGQPWPTRGGQVSPCALRVSRPVLLYAESKPAGNRGSLSDKKLAPFGPCCGSLGGARLTCLAHHYPSTHPSTKSEDPSAPLELMLRCPCMDSPPPRRRWSPV